jgi:exosome complex component RRP4
MKNKEIVYPGQIITDYKEGLELEGCFIEDNKVISKYYGIVEISDNKIKVVPLGGVYIPKIGDYVIGEIMEVMPNMWLVNIKSPFTATILLKDAFNERIDPEKTDLSSFYDVGDLVYGKINNITRNKTVRFSLRDSPKKKLKGGLLIEIHPNRVPKVIGKKGKTINMIEEKLNVEIIVGRNGLIWIKGENRDNELKAAEIIKLIDKYSHIENLSDKIKEILERNLSTEEIKKL